MNVDKDDKRCLSAWELSHLASPHNLYRRWFALYVWQVFCPLEIRKCGFLVLSLTLTSYVTLGLSLQGWNKNWRLNPQRLSFFLPAPYVLPQRNNFQAIKDTLPSSNFSQNDYFDTFKQINILKYLFLHFSFLVLLIVSISTCLVYLLDNPAVVSSPCWASVFSSKK